MAQSPPPMAGGSSSSAPGGPTSHSRPSARGTGFYSRRRAVRACQVCRARRTKCDNLKPSCSFCLKVGAVCIQSPVDLSSFDPASLKILERLDDLEELLKSGSAAGPPTASSVKATPAEVEMEMETPETKWSEAPHEPISLAAVLPQNPDHVLSWPVFQAMRVALGLHDAGSLADSSPAVAAASSPHPVLNASDMDPRRINALLDNFFAFAHVKNPVLDEVATRDMVLSVVINGMDWSPNSCLTSLICALGSIATPFGPSLGTVAGTAAYASAESFFHAAERRLGLVLSADDALAAQCLFLSGVYMMCTFRPVRAWRFFLQSLATCQQFPFLSLSAQQHSGHATSAATAHLLPTSPPTAAANEHYPLHVLQQATYWSSWKSEREVRGEFCGDFPDFGVSEHKSSLGLYPPFFPTPPAPRVDDTDGGGGAPTDSGLARERISWYFYLAEISLRRLSARIAAEMVGLRDEANERKETRAEFLAAVVEAVPRYEELARGWIASLPECLSFDAPAEDDDVCRFVLRGHAINLFELIYWPVLSAWLDNLSANTAHGSQMAAAANSVMLVQRALDHHLLRLLVNKPGYRHRHHGTLPMMLSCSRSALVLLAAALLDRHEEQRSGRATGLRMPCGWESEVDEVIDMLAFWSSETSMLDNIHQVLDRARATIRHDAAPAFPP